MVEIYSCMLFCLISEKKAVENLVAVWWNSIQIFSFSSPIIVFKIKQSEVVEEFSPPYFMLWEMKKEIEYGYKLAWCYPISWETHVNTSKESVGIWIETCLLAITQSTDFVDYTSKTKERLKYGPHKSVTCWSLWCQLSASTPLLVFDPNLHFFILLTHNLPFDIPPCEILKNVHIWCILLQDYTFFIMMKCNWNDGSNLDFVIVVTEVYVDHSTLSIVRLGDWSTWQILKQFGMGKIEGILLVDVCFLIIEIFCYYFVLCCNI